MEYIDNARHPADDDVASERGLNAPLSKWARPPAFYRWSYMAEADPSVVVSEDLVVIASDRGDVTAVDDSGVIRWQRRVTPWEPDPDPWSRAPKPAIVRWTHHGLGVVTTTGVHILDPDDGGDRLVWDGGRRVSQLASSEEHLLIVDEAGLTAIDPTGGTRWHVSRRALGPPHDTGEVIGVVRAGTTLTIFDSATGKQLSRTNIKTRTHAWYSFGQGPLMFFPADLAASDPRQDLIVNLLSGDFVYEERRGSEIQMPPAVVAELATTDPTKMTTEQRIVWASFVGAAEPFVSAEVLREARRYGIRSDHSVYEDVLDVNGRYQGMVDGTPVIIDSTGVVYAAEVAPPPSPPSTRHDPLEVAWETVIRGWPSPSHVAGIVVDEDDVFALADGVWAFDRASGQGFTLRDPRHDEYEPLVEVVATPRHIVAVNARRCVGWLRGTWELVLDRDLPNPRDSAYSPKVRVCCAAGAAVVISVDDQVHALDIASGQIQWTRPLATPFRPAYGWDWANGTVSVFDGDSGVVAWGDGRRWWAAVAIEDGSDASPPFVRPVRPGTVVDQPKGSRTTSTNCGHGLSSAMSYVCSPPKAHIAPDGVIGSTAPPHNRLRQER